MSDKKRIYFIQTGFSFGGNSLYLPYASGCLIAYARQFDDINAEYEFEDIIFRRGRIADVLDSIKDPYMAAFSVSVWNSEYCFALARAVKERYPDVLIVFGGHSVAEEAGYLTGHPYIDVLMFGEGERNFTALLRAHGSAAALSDAAYRGADGMPVFTPRTPNADIEDYPSPYLTGVFDSLIENNPDVDFLSVLETNRGCPYSCAYCDWCAGRKVRFFPLEKVFAEIDWLSSHKIGYCFCADSNFGMFKRDLQIVDKLVDCKTRTGCPEVFRPCYAKHSDEQVFEICRRLNTCGMDKGATLAYQSLWPHTLRAVHRENLDMEHFSHILERYNRAGIPSYSELILGLPEETLESFSRGLAQLLESGQHNSVSVYYCEMLPNSPMNVPEYIKKYGLHTEKVAFNHIHSAPGAKEEIPEYSYLITATAAMPHEDWVRANLFSITLQAFHSLGLLRAFAMYLRCEMGVPYYDFYESLLSYILSLPDGGLLSGLYRTFRERLEDSFKGDWNYHSPKFGPVTWFFEEGLYLECLYAPDLFKSEIRPFLDSFNIPSPVYAELAVYQQTMLKRPEKTDKTIAFGSNFHEFFRGITTGRHVELTQTPCKLRFFNDKSYEKWSDFARETVWYGRRRGAQIIEPQDCPGGAGAAVNSEK